MAAGQGEGENALCAGGTLGARIKGGRGLDLASAAGKDSAGAL